MPSFKMKNFAGGLNQSADESLISVNQSRDAQNVDVSSGTLKSISGYSKYIVTAVPAGRVGTMVETVPPFAVERQAIIDLPRPSYASVAPVAVSLCPPVPEY